MIERDRRFFANSDRPSLIFPSNEPMERGLRALKRRFEASTRCRKQRQADARRGSAKAVPVVKV